MANTIIMANDHYNDDGMAIDIDYRSSTIWSMAIYDDDQCLPTVIIDKFPYHEPIANTIIIANDHYYDADDRYGHWYW